MLVESGKIYVRNLRARSRERDALALRLRLDAALSAMDLHPQGVPASAIVCVRSLRTRQPHTSGREHAGGSRGWEVSVAETLAALAARAARPAHGPVPDTAEAVLFADRAELLACLAVDWLKGAATAERWWWRSLLSARAGSRALVLGEWLKAPEHVPAALEHLARGGLAVAFARALSADEARDLLARVTHAYGAEGLRDAADEITRVGDETNDARDDSRGADTGATGRDVRTQAEGARAAPWLAHAEEASAQGLGPEQQSLLGIGLSLARVPHRARSLSFAREVREWRAASLRASAAPAPEGRDDAEAVAHEPAPVAANDSGQPALHASPFEDDSQGVEAHRPRQAFEHSSEGSRRGEGDSVPVPSGLEVSAEDGGQEGAESSADELEMRAHADAEGKAGEAPGPVSNLESDAVESRGAWAEGRPGASDEGAREVAPPRLLEARVETKLGGLFYLVNVGLFLELYGDFTTPLRPGLALPVWDFVALVGRELYGPEVCEDPVWQLLARLSGREADEQPGRGFEPPREWRVPASWLAPFGEEGFRRWAFEDGRIRLRHERGFVALDVPTRPEHEHGESVTLETWVGWVAGYVEARLRLALGVAEGRGLARLVCEQEARVAVTASHVDVYFRLAGLPIEVRLAGLDRDPGWVPAAGRYVAFHYE